jgi:hypothetical protein
MSFRSIFCSSVSKFVSLHIKVKKEREKLFHTIVQAQVNKYFLYSRSSFGFHLMRKALMNLRMGVLRLKLVKMSVNAFKHENKFSYLITSK